MTRTWSVLRVVLGAAIGLFVVLVITQLAPAEEVQLPVEINKAVALEVENLGLKIQMIQMQLQTLQREGQRLQTEQLAVAKDAAEKLGLKWEEVDLDLANRQFVAKPKPAAKPAETPTEK